MTSAFSDRLLSIEGVTASPSMFRDGAALWVNGREILHEDTRTLYDLRLTRQVIRRMRARLRAEPRVRLRTSSSADWIEVESKGPDDEELLVALVTAAADAHRPPTGATMRPPPRDGELARRRRLH